jgi:hypothetical protein
MYNCQHFDHCYAQALRTLLGSMGKELGCSALGFYCTSGAVANLKTNEKLSICLAVAYKSVVVQNRAKSGAG